MGRLILCNGKKAENPWYVKETDTKLYSMEELCYYIYNNVYIISRSFFTPGLADWLEEELGLSQLAKKLKGLILKRNSVKDLVVTLLCGSDYYLEKEIKELIRVMDELEHMSEAQRGKYKADLWLKKGRYTLAAVEYRKLLGDLENGLTVEEIGNIYHNLGIACLYTGTLTEAARHFLKAYGRNQRRESLMAYVVACRMAEHEVAQVSEEEAAQLLQGFESSEREYLEAPDYQRLCAAKEKKLAGNAAAYYEEIDQLLREWKQEYRRKVG